jgi:hypothetical protein
MDVPAAQMTHTGIARFAAPATWLSDPADCHPSITAGPTAAPNPSPNTSNVPSSTIEAEANSFRRDNTNVKTGSNATPPNAAGANTPWLAMNAPSDAASTPAPKEGKAVQ